MQNCTRSVFLSCGTASACCCTGRGACHPIHESGVHTPAMDASEPRKESSGNEFVSQDSLHYAETNGLRDKQCGAADEPLEERARKKHRGRAGEGSPSSGEGSAGDEHYAASSAGAGATDPVSAWQRAAAHAASLLTQLTQSTYAHPNAHIHTNALHHLAHHAHHAHPYLASPYPADQHPAMADTPSSTEHPHLHPEQHPHPHPHAYATPHSGHPSEHPHHWPSPYAGYYTGPHGWPYGAHYPAQPMYAHSLPNFSPYG